MEISGQFIFVLFRLTFKVKKKKPSKRCYSLKKISREENGKELKKAGEAGSFDL